MHGSSPNKLMAFNVETLNDNSSIYLYVTILFSNTDLTKKNKIVQSTFAETANVLCIR